MLLHLQGGYIRMDATFDPNAMAATFAWAAQAVGVIGVTEVVKETTKDAFKAFKSKVSEIWGKSGSSAAEKVEADPSSVDAVAKLEAAMMNVPAEDEKEVVLVYKALLDALMDDESAKKAGAQVASIKLDIESGKNVRIGTLKSARTIDIKSRSEGDFDLGNVEMDPGERPGN